MADFMEEDRDEMDDQTQSGQPDIFLPIQSLVCLPAEEHREGGKQ